MTEEKKEETATQRLAKKMTNKEAVPESRQTNSQATAEYIRNVMLLCLAAVLFALALL